MMRFEFHGPGGRDGYDLVAEGLVRVENGKTCIYCEPPDGSPCPGSTITLLEEPHIRCKEATLAGDAFTQARDYLRNTLSIPACISARQDMQHLIITGE